MIKTEMVRTEKPKQTEGQQMKDFSVSYSYMNNKNVEQETSCRIAGYSLSDVKTRLEEVLGGRPVQILTHDSGNVIHGLTRPLVRNIIKHNLKWYNKEIEVAGRQEKIDKMHASKSAKIDKARDGAKNADITKKLQQAHNKSKYI